MWRALRARFHQGHRTLAFPEDAPALPERFRGAPVLAPDLCPESCRACIEACPTDAISVEEAGPRTLQKAGPRIDLGRCLFCGECSDACPEEAIRFTRDYRLAASARSDLVVGAEAARPRVAALEERTRRLFGRSLRLRQVSAGGCNACESDVSVLSTIVFDLSRFGIQFVASPRHADGLLITGALSRNMRLALEKTWAAVPAPKLVIAVGACAISGGPYRDHPEVCNGAGAILPVDLYVPGCPPHPLTILDGLLRLLGQLEGGPGRGGLGPDPLTREPAQFSS